MLLRRGKSLSRWKSRSRCFCKVALEIKKQRQKQSQAQEESTTLSAAGMKVTHGSSQTVQWIETSVLGRLAGQGRVGGC